MNEHNDDNTNGHDGSAEELHGANAHEYNSVNAHGYIDGHAHVHSSEHAHPHAHPHAYTKAVLNRLSRLIGHLNAVRNMVEQGRDCSEILIQLAAVRAATNKTCEIILKEHLEHCIVDAVKTGDSKALDEMNKAVELLMK
jgi:DNA-binding FrmR family transcriptional regulator